MPRSLIARAALILLLPVVTLQLAISVGFVQRYYEDVTRQMTRSLLLELRVLSAAVAAEPDLAAAQERAREVGGPLEIETTLPARPPTADNLSAWDLSGRVMAETLREALPNLRAVAVHEPRRVAIWLSTPHGGMRVEFSRRRVAAAAPHQLVVLTLVLGLVLTAVAYLFLRNQVRPIQRLARAATAYGRGRVVPFRPAGALEVRAAGTAFLDMRHRIERQAQARTAMLAGISHDLRTPLTRLRLGLSLLDDPEAADLIRDVDDMSRMMDAFLAFARGDAGDMQEPTAVALLVREVVEDYRRTGQPVDLSAVEGTDPGPVPMRPLALRRAIENLLGNALSHGTRARVSLGFGERTIRVTVEDDGPGIPPEQREEAMRPFVRLDPARNQDRAGVGLGLAIVADIARTHGGQLRLGTSADLGGLRADLVLAL
ncbi:ATP-binding protein [Rubellimicrobium roseum]|nr:ATP-binding protein [Rubellimicrobium roseum]